MANGNEICRMDAVTLAALIRSKKLSAMEVTDAVLARMEKLEPILHAFCTPTPEIAREAAKQIDKRIMANEEVGPLAGVPWGCKDLICTAGIKTTSGSVAYADFVPDEDDVVVERMRNAGAVDSRKTNVPEFGYSGVGQQPGLSNHPQPLEHGPDARRLQCRFGRCGSKRHGAGFPRKRWRRICSHTEQLFWLVWPEGLNGSCPALSRCQG